MNNGKGGCIYLLTNKNNTTIYVGVTSDLRNRILENRQKKYPKSFSARYNLNKLVYYETFHSIEEAINREKQIKAGSRKTKEDLINSIILSGMICLRKSLNGENTRFIVEIASYFAMTVVGEKEYCALQ